VATQLVEAPRYKPESRRFDSRYGRLLPYYDSGSTQGCFLGGKGGRCVGLTTLPPSCADFLKILEASTSWTPLGLSRPVLGPPCLSPIPVAERSKGGGSEADRLLGLRIRISPWACMSVSYKCCVCFVSAIDRSLVQRSPADCDVSKST
jgi:hypothetical protein